MRREVQWGGRWRHLEARELKMQGQLQRRRGEGAPS